MILWLNTNVRLEDLRDHPPEAVEKLRALLAVGIEARVDPRRKDFYELEDGSQVFYIHVCPNGKVLLLAIWQRENKPASPRFHAQPTSSAFC
jgi:hypothetical protein